MRPTSMRPSQRPTRRSRRGARRKPLERAAVVRAIAATLRAHADELALLDARNGGNPIAEMGRDVQAAAAQLDYCAGLALEVRGETIPMGSGAVDMTRARAVRRGRAHRRVQPSADVHGREDGPAADRRQHGDHEAAAAGAAVGVPDDGADRRSRAAGRGQPAHRRRAVRRRAGRASARAASRADRQRADRVARSRRARPSG